MDRLASEKRVFLAAPAIGFLLRGLLRNDMKTKISEPLLSTHKNWIGKQYLECPLCGGSLHVVKTEFFNMSDDENHVLIKPTIYQFNASTVISTEGITNRMVIHFGCSRGTAHLENNPVLVIDTESNGIVEFSKAGIRMGVINSKIDFSPICKQPS